MDYYLRQFEIGAITRREIIMNQKTEILKAQFAIEQAYIAYFQTRIQTGVYKKRFVEQMNKNGEYVKLTEEELLDDELNTLIRHIHRMEALTEEMMGFVVAKINRDTGETRTFIPVLDDINEHITPELLHHYFLYSR